MGWAVTNWIYLEGRALKDGLIRGGSLLSYEPMLFLSYVESIIREFATEDVDRLYDPVVYATNRASNIRAALEVFG